MKKLGLALLFTFLLQGCLAGAFVAGSAATGGVVTDPRSLGTIKTDEQINFKVNRKLVNDPVISAVSYNRVVLLTGQAYDEELRHRAEEYAQAVPNVKRVFNRITLGIPTTAYRRAKDIAITSSVKTRMFADSRLKSNNFKIVTENGVVYILGLATKKQANIAVAIARKVSGVQQVVKLIEYKEE
ncbi:BON domain-containing protein [Rickettsiella massiliensis]|uniref:BON domain-containing protein n=1 Tax=Rickettsiella massiliensis TaxID=676517 RepID=UPI000299F857|nr:BON domain-containing protein [Rickettsiella massiliensis]